ncbi:DUF1990 family protein [Pseudonocardia acaciae]|uniref:DUF1990 family protein n=1 Tax=Pseudonocardia acaciae TaxID=551276 RepID=UPI00068874E7|nr:DUF1990 domain-containing protein [Pseudonocardia acaciae]
MTRTNADRRWARRYPTDRAATPTYPEVGATKPLALGEKDEPPAGYHYLRRTVRAGHGDTAFAQAREVVLGWGMQHRAGGELYPPEVRPEEGRTALVITRLGPVPLVTPCRVVWRLDDDRHAGFGYGTLPGHPVRGEEAFLVTRDDSGDVWVTVLAFSRPATWYAKLAGPLGRLAQRWTTARYLSAIR